MGSPPTWCWVSITWRSTKPKAPTSAARPAGSRFASPRGSSLSTASRTSLTINAAPHHLHGGTKGLSKVVWHAESLSGSAVPAVKFTHRSPDGDQGYPGNLELTVVYTLTKENELKIEYTAVTDQPTPVNLTHHTYFNLNGAGRGTSSTTYSKSAPAATRRWTARAFPAAASPRWPARRWISAPTAIGNRMQPGSEVAGGYDASYLVDRTGPEPVLVATLAAPASGRRLDVFSTEPALVLYTGNYLDGTLRGKQRAVYGKHAGVCLETAHLPDSVNRPEFPSIILRPGQIYRQTCIYRFSAR